MEGRCERVTTSQHQDALTETPSFVNFFEGENKMKPLRCRMRQGVWYGHGPPLPSQLRSLGSVVRSSSDTWTLKQFVQCHAKSRTNFPWRWRPVGLRSHFLNMEAIAPRSRHLCVIISHKSCVWNKKSLA